MSWWSISNSASICLTDRVVQIQRLEIAPQVSRQAAIGSKDHVRIALPRSSSPISTTLLHCVSVSDSGAPVRAGGLAGISDSCADVAVRRRRPPHVAGRIARGGGRRSGCEPLLPDRLLGWLVRGLRFIEGFRHVGSSSLVRCPDMFTGFWLTGQGSSNATATGSLESAGAQGSSVRSVDKASIETKSGVAQTIGGPCRYFYWRDHKRPAADSGHNRRIVDRAARRIDFIFPRLRVLIR